MGRRFLPVRTVSRRCAAAGRGFLLVRAQALRAVRASISEPFLKLLDGLLQCRAERVVACLRAEIRAGRHEVRAHAECGTRLEAAFDHDPRFLDVDLLPEQLDVLANQSGEGRGRLVIDLAEREFHGTALVARRTWNE